MILLRILAAAISWGIRIYLGLTAVTVMALIAVPVAGHLRRLWRCDPCHGRPGICTCKSKARCRHPLCGAADTGVSNADFSRELRALLDKDGGQR
jgi:hypothetical protein